ncbi:carbohydrate esterase family 4 protein [Mycena vitilis]|nr:carbohydrate esterase family 4 protein [Mycena vitilis]
MLARTTALIASALLSTASPLLNATAFATVYDRCVTSNTIALTFDDGPYIYENKISDFLTQSGAKGTFFVNGNNYDCIYDEDVVPLLRYTFEAGHQICSHTWSHPDLATLSATKTALLKVLGITTKYLRPPYGSYNKRVRQVASSYNKSLVVWDFDSGDSVNKTWQESEALYDDTIVKQPANLLPLNHETEENTALILVPWLIEKLQGAGYKLVTLAECLGEEPYVSKGTYGVRDASLFAASIFLHSHRRHRKRGSAEVQDMIARTGSFDRCTYFWTDILE